MSRKTMNNLLVHLCNCYCCWRMLGNWRNYLQMYHICRSKRCRSLLRIWDRNLVGDGLHF